MIWDFVVVVLHDIMSTFTRLVIKFENKPLTSINSSSQSALLIRTFLAMKWKRYRRQRVYCKCLLTLIPSTWRWCANAESTTHKLRFINQSQAVNSSTIIHQIEILEMMFESNPGNIKYCWDETGRQHISLITNNGSWFITELASYWGSTVAEGKQKTVRVSEGSIAKFNLPW